MSSSLHHTRLPAGLVSGIRGRNPRRIARDIRHPLAVLLTLLVMLAAGAALAVWIMILAVGWAVLGVCAAIGWVWDLPFRRHRQPRVSLAGAAEAAEQWSRQQAPGGDGGAG